MSKANFDLPAEKLSAVLLLSGAKTKKEAIIIALDSYLKRKKIEELMQSYGKFSLTWTQKTLKKYRD